MRKRKQQLVPGKDYIIDTDGRCVLTGAYLKSLGVCCGKDCRYCPYPKHPEASMSRMQEIVTPVTVAN